MSRVFEAEDRRLYVYSMVVTARCSWSVEDEDLVRILTCRTLERAGAEGFCVALLEEAVELRDAGVRALLSEKQPSLRMSLPAEIAALDDAAVFFAMSPCTPMLWRRPSDMTEVRRATSWRSALTSAATTAMTLIGPQAC